MDSNAGITEYPYLTQNEFARCINEFEQRFGAEMRTGGSKSIKIKGGDTGQRRQYLQITRRLYKQDKEKWSDNSSDEEETDELFDIEDPDPVLPADSAPTYSKAVEVGWIDYHVVYSPSWKVPVLYMCMYMNEQGEDARVVLDATEITNAVVSDRDVSRAMSAVEFGGALGVQDHPILGNPYMYLHPCHTATLMRTVGSSFSDGLNETEYLAAWLSLVGPAVGLTLPSVP
ncbi:E2-like conjugating enzyme atg10 [Coemansia sp. RSA 1933]|nr:E2-like conjugating enzyme atg10 [Coemansia sp. RSA 1933]